MSNMDPNSWFQSSAPKQGVVPQPHNSVVQPDASIYSSPGVMESSIITPQTQVITPHAQTFNFTQNGVAPAQPMVYGPQSYPAGSNQSTGYSAALATIAQQPTAFVYNSTTPQVDEATIGATQHGAKVTYWLGIFLVAILTAVCLVVITGHASTVQRFSRLGILLTDILLAGGMVLLGRKLKTLLADRPGAISSLSRAVALCSAVALLSVAEFTIELTLGKHAIIPLQGLLSLAAATYLFIVRTHLRSLP